MLGFILLFDDHIQFCAPSPIDFLRPDHPNLTMSCYFFFFYIFSCSYIVLSNRFQGSFIHKVAKTVGITSKDSKEAEHKEQFTALVREVKGVLNANNCPYLSISVLPHVNSSGNYYE